MKLLPTFITDNFYAKKELQPLCFVKSTDLKASDLKVRKALFTSVGIPEISCIFQRSVDIQIVLLEPFLEQSE